MDFSFDAGSGVNGTVTAVALQPDGKVIIAGTFTTVKGLIRRNIARLNADGSGDSSFNFVNAPMYYPTQTMALQRDGKLLVAPENGGLFRLNPDGSSDGSFSPSLSFWWDQNEYEASILSMAVQPDGKVIIGGWFILASGGFGIARLNADGSFDTGFNPDQGYAGGVESIALQSDGKVLARGYGGLVRYQANGTTDNTFVAVGGGKGSLIVQPDGKVLVAAAGVTRVNTDGSLDNTFNASITYGNGHAWVRSIAVQSDGKISIGGDFDKVNGTDRNLVARLNANGSLDSSFDPGAGARGSVYSIALQADGRGIIGGNFLTVNGTNRRRVAQLNADGTLASAFDAGGGVDPGPLSTVADGTVRVGDTLLNANGSFNSYITPPTTPPFPADLSFPDSDYSIATCGATQPDGKRLIGGYLVGSHVDPFSGELTQWTQTFLRRFNVDASRDTNFNEFVGGPDYSMGDPFSPMVVTLQPDGKILFGARGIRRLNVNGTVDTYFVASVAPVSKITLQADGRIWITGGFTIVNGTNRGGIARLNTNGTLDNTFNPGTGANATVSSLCFQPDGKVFIGGDFTSVNGTNRNRVARLNADGGLDTSFNPGAGPNGRVDFIALQRDGNVLISGDFLNVNGAFRPAVARLIGDFRMPSLAIARSNGYAIVSWPVTVLNGQLQETTDLSLPNSWSAVAQATVTNGTVSSVTVPITPGKKFFRLRLQW